MPRLLPLSLLIALALSTTACRDPGPTATVAAEAGGSGIAAVQGREARSPLEGRQARIEGVVTLAWPDGNGGGFVQALATDGDPATSEALFVIPAGGLPPLQVGQHVRAEGLVGETGEGARLTTLADARVEVLGEAALPEPVLLSALPAEEAAWEALEGMRVRIAGPLVVSGNDNLGRFGEVTLAAGGRLFTPTEQVAPGTAATERAAANRARSVVLDDASIDENPAAVAWLPAPLSDAAPLRAGSVLRGIDAVVDERFGDHRLQATAAVGAIEQAPRPAPPRVDGDVRIAGMNLLNLFNGDGQGGGFPTERGARSAEAHRQQLAKHVATITALDPQVIAAQEMENDGYGRDSAIRQLAEALNRAQPGARWMPVVPPRAPGTDAISVALLYRADQVTAVGAAAVDLDGPFRRGSRPPLAQAFRKGSGPLFTVVSVHFKSKGGCEEAEGEDRDQGDGQACFNAQRVASVQALQRWIEADPTRTGSERVLLVGDFNAYAEEDPMRWLRERGWSDPLQGEGSYSFVFAAQAGRLDHALLNAPMQAALRGAAKWHSNSDEALAFAYFGPLGREGEATPWRASDHDPMLLGFDLGAPAR